MKITLPPNWNNRPTFNEWVKKLPDVKNLEQVKKNDEIFNNLKLNL